MQSLQKSIKEIIHRAVTSAFPVSEEILLTNPAKNMKCDYVCPVAMKIYSVHKVDNHFMGLYNPREVAADIVTQIPANPIIKDIEISGPGFLNIIVNSDFIQGKLTSIVAAETLEIETDKSETVAVDFSSPNIAKEMHVGHLRSTIIGESMSRILEFCRNKVYRINHLGDWGTQFGMLIAYLERNHPNFLEEDNHTLADLMAFYKASKKCFDDDKEFNVDAHKFVVQLQSGDERCLKIWKKICGLSSQGFNEIYRRLDATIEECGESFYNPYISPLLEELEQRGIVTEDGGAKVIFIEKSPIPLIVRKRDGGIGYDSTDVAAIYYRLNILRSDRLIYITDSGQEFHFHLIEQAAKRAGWLDEKLHRVDHMGFGVILGPDGKKFKTRSGETVKLADLLDEAKSKAKERIVERMGGNEEGKDTGSKLSEAEIDHAAEVMGIACVKYFDLKQNRVSAYSFAYDKMLDPKGNTGIYLLYAYARIQNIIKKSGKTSEDIAKLSHEHVAKIEDPSERKLGIALLKFPETIEAILEDLMLNRLTDFLYELCGIFNEFYKKCRVVGDPKEVDRLIMCEATRLVMKKCFDLLGMNTLDRI